MPPSPISLGYLKEVGLNLSQGPTRVRGHAHGSNPESRRKWQIFACGAAVISFLTGAHTAAADPSGLAVELNKLESEKDGCRAYFVITNNNATAYQVLKLDLIQFQPDGVIGHRFAVDLGPLKPQKRTVKLFDINTPCEQVGSLLINDVVDCKGESGPIPNCLANITATSLTKQQLSK
jgi:hypothetical protein